MTEAAEALDRLLALQERLERGPKREGVFAVWLLARVAHDLGTDDEDPDRASRRRIALLDRRLAPLTVPRPLARGIATALGHLQEGTPSAARIALSQLVAPARDALGAEAAEALARLARDIHDNQAAQTRRAT